MLDRRSDGGGWSFEESAAANYRLAVGVLAQAALHAALEKPAAC